MSERVDDDDAVAAATTPPGRLAMLTLAFGIGYVVAVVAGRQTIVPGTHLALISPAAGVAAVWFAFVRPWRWRAGSALLVLAVSAVAAASTGLESREALGLGVANASQVLLLTWFLERGEADGSPASFGERLDVERLAALTGRAMLAALLVAGFGPASFIDLGPDNLRLVVAWVIRNAVTVVAFYPLAMLLRDHLAHGDRSRPGSAQRWPLLRWLELGALTAATGLTCWLVFGGQELPVAFLVLATSAWVGARFTPLVANLHTLLAGAAVALMTLNGRGLFAAVDDPVTEAAIVQAFLAVSLAVAMALALHRRTNDRLTARLAEAEREARRQSEMLSAVLAASEESVVVLDRAGRVLMRNRAAVRLAGGPADSGLPLADIDLRRPGGPPLLPQELPQARALAGETVVAEDYVLRTRYKPEPVIVQLSAVKVESADGEPLAVLLSHDVTAVRRERDELASFAGVVAHDLLNPLTAVDGWADALEDELDAPDPDVAVLRSHLARVRRGSDRMHALIRDLLAYTTARSGELRPVPVDLGELVGDVVAQRLEAARAGGVEPEITVEPLPMVNVEPVLVRQAIDNVVGNALKYVAPGVTPRLHIRCRRIPAGERGPSPELVELEVADNGIGIPADQRAAVFDTFHRVHRDGYKGTGLGLSIVKRIAERHGGSVVAAENPGGGTVIRLRLPAPR